MKLSEMKVKSKIQIESKPIIPIKKKIFGDKTLDKDKMINWFVNLFQEKGEIFTLDYLRGQKQSFEAVYEMRK